MSIILSPKHGANPSIDCCFICGKDVAVVLFGKLKNDKEAPKKCCTGQLCDDCKKQLETHVAVFEVTNDSNPKRTGRMVFLPKEAIAIENKGICYMLKEEFVKLFNNKENEIA